jgi:hypothetical protein
MKHTPEPWSKEDFQRFPFTDITQRGLQIEDFAHSVACVNACAGMGFEEIEDVGNTYRRLVAETLRAEAQRDELLEALEMAAAVMTACDAPEEAQLQVRELIAKMKGTNP